MKAVIYCRVSTKEQTEGYSLETQEQECLKFAQRNTYEIAKRFIERGESAKTAERTELQKLLNYIKENKKLIDYVIVYKIDRLSRNVVDISSLRLIFSKLGIELKSATEHFDDSAVGKLTANMLASMAQFDNDVRSERTILGMKKALQEGRWVSAPPVGYEFKKDLEEKSKLVPNEKAAYIQKAFELFNTGLYKQSDIVSRLKKDGLKSISKQKLNQILRNPIYMGYMKHNLLEEPMKGKYKPLISEGDFSLAQQILSGRKPNLKPREANNPSFPLRQFAICPECKKGLTGSRSKGRNKRYAYYHCTKKGHQNIRKEILEEKFINFLNIVKPNEKTMKRFESIIKKVWDERQVAGKGQKRRIDKEIASLKAKQQRITALVIDGTFDKSTFQQQKQELDGEIAVKTIELNELVTDMNDVSSCINYCTDFVQNLDKLWLDSNVDLKQRFQNIIFPEGIYFENGIIGTTKMCSLFEVLSPNNTLESNEAPGAGLEALPEGIEGSGCSPHPQKKEKRPRIWSVFFWLRAKDVTRTLALI